MGSQVGEDENTGGWTDNHVRPYNPGKTLPSDTVRLKTLADLLDEWLEEDPEHDKRYETN